MTDATAPSDDTNNTPSNGDAVGVPATPPAPPEGYSSAVATTDNSEPVIEASLVETEDLSAAQNISAAQPVGSVPQPPQPTLPIPPQPTTGFAPIDAEQHPALAKPATKRPAVVGLVAALAVGALIGGVSGAGATLWATSLNATAPTVNSSSPTTITVNDPQDATQVTAVAAKASPSVVTISASSSSAAGTGSGVILSSDGYVLTNTHVVTLDGATADATVSVQTHDGRLLKASIVGTDPISDLAVIKVEGVDDLVPAEFADSTKLNVGDTAIAIGAPLGLSNTVTDGIISALNRSITVASSAAPETQEDAVPEDQGDSGQAPFDFWPDVQGQDNTQAPTNVSSTISLAVIQTDAAINPGNSGGALLDSDGKVIGINVAIATAGSSEGQSGSIGVGFAVPSSYAKRIAEELIANGKATHGLLGASVVDVTEDENQTDATVVGASVRELTQGGAAAAAGLEVGDIITGFNGLPISGKNDLTAQVRTVAAGGEATVTYVRAGKTSTVDVTLGTLQ